MTNIGFNIRKIREEKGLSQEYVAHELGINQSTYGKLERENCKISVDRLYKIAEILNEDITKILNIIQKTLLIKPISIMVMVMLKLYTLKIKKFMNNLVNSLRKKICF